MYSAIPSSSLIEAAPVFELCLRERAGRRGLVVAGVWRGDGQRGDRDRQRVDGEQLLIEQFLGRGAVEVDGWLGDHGWWSTGCGTCC